MGFGCGVGAGFGVGAGVGFGFGVGSVGPGLGLVGSGFGLLGFVVAMRWPLHVECQRLFHVERRDCPVSQEKGALPAAAHLVEHLDLLQLQKLIR